MRCQRCHSGHVKVQTVTFTWNSATAKQVDVAWCANCDLVFPVYPSPLYPEEGPERRFPDDPIIPEEPWPEIRYH
jgi:hypothetical protein